MFDAVLRLSFTFANERDSSFFCAWVGKMGEYASLSLSVGITDYETYWCMHHR